MTKFCMRQLAMLLLGIVSLAAAQQPAGVQMYTAYPGLSESCQRALATNVSCPPFITVVSQSNAILDAEQVSELCVEGCYTSLESAKADIEAVCTSMDVIVYETVAYPATFIVDNYLLTYQLSCRKDGATGEYCDPQILTWSNQTFMNDTQLCSDCWLGGLAVQLGSPLSYDAGLEDKFSSLSSSCNATGYSYTSPTAYALNATATTPSATVTATPAPTCTGSYVVQSADDCNSVAKALSVSTYSLLSDNSLDIYCQNFATMVNSSLCIPPQCETYTWQALDTCNTVVGGLGNVTLAQFLAWNPNFNSLCQNGVNFIGYEVCISPPGGYVNQTSDGDDSMPMTSVTTPVPAPTNAMTGSNAHCSHWYTVVEGDTCASVSIANSISLTDFYFLNPEINANCTNLLLGEAYCVAPVGAITTYSGYTVTGGWATITVPTASFPSIDTAIPMSTGDPGYIYIPVYLPTAPGTLEGCYTYRNYSDYAELNGCTWIAALYDLTTDQLLEWNPSLSSNLTTCELQPGYSYCVERYANQTLPADDGTYSYCLDVDTIEPRTASDCNCFTKVDGWLNGDYGCDEIAEDFDLTLTQLTMWNPWLSGDCNTALYANLTDGNDSRAVCIGVGNTTTTATTRTATPTTTTPTATTMSMGPTQTGIVAGCQQFHTVQSGDSCSSVESEFGISFPQLYEWNPSIGSNCESLWLGPSSPTQTGITSNCNAWYTVPDGASCTSIETQFGITFAQLYAWNPAIGSNSQTSQNLRPARTARQIKQALQKDGHRIWGFVVYRCTYKSDADWDEFMRRLRWCTQNALELYHAQELMDSLGLTVLEDRALFDGATTSTIRNHFKQWAETAVEAEQGVGVRQRASQRYRYCIQVDEEALDSVVRKSPVPWGEIPGNNVGYVNLISKEWEPYDPVEYEDEDERLEEPPEEPIEGCTLHDVGWMKVLYDSVMVSKYNYLRESLAWEYEYRRPPQVSLH
ncbi:hypothetical protein CNMCM6936_004141 [Aspergillus lentulus]|nr:hypothetical protein CNMCM6936_004141 [Aspergillus lentulus]KAF4177111.1 hypothetical protein CNMCM7927_003542 [Aspergillus lentulus]